MVRPAVENIHNFSDMKRKVAFEPYTVELEKLVLTKLQAYARDTLAKYPTTLEDDEAMIRTPNLPYHRLCCYRLIIGEKKSLQEMLLMVELGLQFLNFPTKAAALIHFASIYPKPRCAPYIEENLFKLFW